MRAIKILLATAGGGFLGVVAGFAAAMALGLFFERMYPEDSTAGSIAIVVIFTAPVGGLFGAMVGAFVAAWLTRNDDPPDD